MCQSAGNDIRGHGDVVRIAVSSDHQRLDPPGLEFRTRAGKNPVVARCQGSTDDILPAVG